jgi:hypothetical protein
MRTHHSPATAATTRTLQHDHRKSTWINGDTPIDHRQPRPRSAAVRPTTVSSSQPRERLPAAAGAGADAGGTSPRLLRRERPRQDVLVDPEEVFRMPARLHCR